MNALTAAELYTSFYFLFCYFTLRILFMCGPDKQDGEKGVLSKGFKKSGCNSIHSILSGIGSQGPGKSIEAVCMDSVCL